jgi:hypothetical protein
LKLSFTPFCHGLAGSMKRVEIPASRSHALKILRDERTAIVAAQMARGAENSANATTPGPYTVSVATAHALARFCAFSKRDKVGALPSVSVPEAS